MFGPFPVCLLTALPPHLFTVGSNDPIGENNVVQWEHKVGETVTHLMGYSRGRLVVQQEGLYYLYSKVTLNAAEECSLVQHKVMKSTKAYDQAIELMKSKRFASPPRPVLGCDLSAL